MTIQTILDRVMLLDNERDLISGGDEVTRGIVAVNLAQDWFELEAALISECFQTDETFTTTASQEYTTWPADLCRIDALWLLDSNGNQLRELERIDRTGAHSPQMIWPLSGIYGSASPSLGAPAEYWGQQQGGKIYWGPRPDTTYTIRGYGLWAKDDYTAAANTFAYPDAVALVIPAIVSDLFRVGLERDLEAVEKRARHLFTRVLSAMANPDHSGPQSRSYSEYHDT